MPEEEMKVYRLAVDIFRVAPLEPVTYQHSPTLTPESWQV